MKYRQNKNYDQPRTPGLMVEVRNSDVNKAMRKLKKKVKNLSQM